MAIQFIIKLFPLEKLQGSVEFDVIKSMRVNSVENVKHS